MSKDRTTRKKFTEGSKVFNTLTRCKGTVKRSGSRSTKVSYLGFGTIVITQTPNQYLK